jgi:hypothetical protein
MSNQIILKKSSVGAKVPTTSDLVYGELALNYADGKLYFKDSSNTIQHLGSSTATETLSNKTLTSPTLTSASLTSATATNLTLAGTLTANSSDGTTGQHLISTGTGVQWEDNKLVNLEDINLSSPQTQQVLTFNGTQWVNADSNAVVASAVFASSQYDMGQVSDSVLTVMEDEGLVTEQTNNIYDLGVLSFTGIISLNNIDQSVKSDYLGYSIIFGF